MSTSASRIGSKGICSDTMLTLKTPSVCKQQRIATRLQFTKSPAVQVKRAWLYMYCVAVVLAFCSKFHLSMITYPVQVPVKARQ